MEGRTTCILPLPLRAPLILMPAGKPHDEQRLTEGSPSEPPPNHDSPAYTTCMAIHMLSAQASAVKDPLSSSNNIMFSTVVNSFPAVFNHLPVLRASAEQSKGDV